MALAPKDVTVTREDLYGWVNAAREEQADTDQFVRERLHAAGYEGETLAIAGEEVDLCDYIVQLLPGLEREWHES